jgi:hypothetical protein
MLGEAGDIGLFATNRRAFLPWDGVSGSTPAHSTKSFIFHSLLGITALGPSGHYRDPFLNDHF